MENTSDSDLLHILDTNTTLQNGEYIIQNNPKENSSKASHLIGRGGFGITYFGYWNQTAQGKLGGSTKTQTPVAIKELFLTSPDYFCVRSDDQKTVVPRFAQDRFQTFKDNFLKEAQTLAKFKENPNIVKALDIFEENGTAYLVMEYLEGTSLQDIIRPKSDEKPRLLFDEITTLNATKDILLALKEVHKEKILHRDIKPANIMVDKSRFTLIDFGIARPYEHNISQLHTTFHTQGYSAPEQSVQVSKRGDYTDIYSVGAVMYFMLTGQPPQTATDLVLNDYENPKSLNPNVSDALDKIITKALEKKHENRYQNADEILEELKKMNEPKKEQKYEQPITKYEEPTRPTEEPQKPKQEIPFTQNNNNGHTTIETPPQQPINAQNFPQNTQQNNFQKNQQNYSQSNPQNNPNNNINNFQNNQKKENHNKKSFPLWLVGVLASLGGMALVLAILWIIGFFNPQKSQIAQENTKKDTTQTTSTTAILSNIEKEKALNDKIISLNNELAQANQQLQNVLANNQNDAQKIAEARQKVANLQKLLQDTQNELAQVKTALAEEKEKNKVLTNENQQQQQQINKLRDDKIKDKEENKKITQENENKGRENLILKAQNYWQEIQVTPGELRKGRFDKSTRSTKTDRIQIMLNNKNYAKPEGEFSFKIFNGNSVEQPLKASFRNLETYSKGQNFIVEFANGYLPTSEGGNFTFKVYYSNPTSQIPQQEIANATFYLK